MKKLYHCRVCGAVAISSVPGFKLYCVVCKTPLRPDRYITDREADKIEKRLERIK